LYERLIEKHLLKLNSKVKVKCKFLTVFEYHSMRRYPLLN